jgi:hypothetical protein
MKSLLAGAALLFAASRSSAQRAADSAAFLYGYRISNGQPVAFADGYRKHLDWHREHGDSISWLGWFVADGPDAGMFIDGAFGKPFAAADARVDPAGDATDAGRTFAAYAVASLREVYRRRADLGRGNSLEAGTPAASQQVTRIRVASGRRAEFEKAARAVASRGDSDHAVYELVSGGNDGTYLVIAQLAGYRAVGGRTSLRRLLDSAGASVTSAESSMWIYHPELSYIVR